MTHVHQFLVIVFLTMATSLALGGALHVLGAPFLQVNCDNVLVATAIHVADIIIPMFTL